MRLAEYIWIDGTEPTRKLRSKTRVISDEGNAANPGLLPEWGFDGSSTNQSPGYDSDLVLKPVRAVIDPLRGAKHLLVLCEVENVDGTPHMTNKRAALRGVLENSRVREENPWFGFEQEYMIFDGRVPLGWPKDRGTPVPQGPYYCGVGADEVFGRKLAELHLTACLDAGLHLYGINAEVAPGQWEFQVGYRPGVDTSVEAIDIADDLWLARWLLYRLGEEFNMSLTIDAKPVAGTWNGSGMHTNFSTQSMRDSQVGRNAIDTAINKLSQRHQEHISVYGVGNNMRLTGEYETCHIDTFRIGESDRGASIRIPVSVQREGYGYIEDRRPSANACPYEIIDRILTTILVEDDQ